MYRLLLDGPLVDAPEAAVVDPIALLYPDPVISLLRAVCRVVVADEALAVVRRDRRAAALALGEGRPPALSPPPPLLLLPDCTICWCCGLQRILPGASMWRDGAAVLLAAALE